MTEMRTRLLGACLLSMSIAGALLASPALAQTYKWKDAQGNTHYTGTPPPPDARSVTEKKLQPSVVEQGASYAEREATRKAPITLWLGNECDTLCESALALLKARGIAYTEQRIITDAQKETFMKRFRLQEARVPAINAGSNHLIGFSADAWTSLLDRAGYPAKGTMKTPPKASSTTDPATDAAETSDGGGDPPPASP
jgi:hypothetical protein